MEILGIASIPVITVIAFLVAEAVKAIGVDKKWLPVICGAVGGVLGVVAMLTMPEFPTHDVLSAIAYGIVSGLAATGAHQVYKQLSDGGRWKMSDGVVVAIITSATSLLLAVVNVIVAALKNRKDKKNGVEKKLDRIEERLDGIETTQKKQNEHDNLQYMSILRDRNGQRHANEREVDRREGISGTQRKRRRAEVLRGIGKACKWINKV